MLGRFWQKIRGRAAIFGLCLTLSLSSLGCSQANSGQKVESPAALVIGSTPQLEEVSPPSSIQQLHLELDQYRPQVEIQGVSANETIEETKLSIRLRVKDYPLYKDQKLGLGPHVNVFLDNLHYQDVYDQSEPLNFSDLSPGTHTVRAVAVRPWEESYKTPGAYDQVTFQVFAPTQSSQPDLTRPILMLNSPQSESSSNPILLDYLVTSPNAKSAQADVTESWKVRVSLKGTSFVTSQESPIYLKGLKPGANWIRLELLDQSEKPILTPLSEVLKVVTITDAGTDALSQLFQGKLTDQDARRTVSQTLSKQLTDAEIQKEQAQTAKAAASNQINQDEDRLAEVATPNPRRKVESEGAGIVRSQQPLKPISPEKAFEKSLEKSLEDDKSKVTETLPLSSVGSAAVGPNLVFDNAFQKPSEPTLASPSEAPVKDKIPLWSKFKARLSSPAKPPEAGLEQPTPEKSVLSSPELSVSSSSLNKLRSAASLQKFLDFQPVDPENLPVIRQKTLRISGSDEAQAQKSAEAKQPSDSDF